MKRWIAILFTLIMVVMTGCSGAKTADKQEEQETDNSKKTSGLVMETQKTDFASSYAQVFRVLDQQSAYYYGGSYYYDGDVEIAEEEDLDYIDMEAGYAEDTQESATKDYSGTNVQEEGVDEGDIVKTDGDYIYQLQYSSVLLIFKVNGKDVELVSKTELDAAREGYATDIYITDNRLAILCERYGYVYIDYDEDYYVEEDMPAYSDHEMARIYVYDISDRTAPKHMATVDQDGYYNTSRLIEDRLYMISTYGLYTELYENEPKSFTPAYYEDGEATYVEAEDILLPPDEQINYRGYTVMGVYDLTGATMLQCQAMVGQTNEIYMNQDGLYLVRSAYETNLTASYKESVYDVEEYTSGDVTTITRYALKDGKLSYVSDGRVSGMVYGQFALDEEDGNLRVVTTGSAHTYRIFTDPEYGFENYVDRDNFWGGGGTFNNLYILNEDMEIVGSLTGLAKDEKVYSVRYDGDIAYFCTFRQIDPLFAVDVSDPTAPKQLSALKIPGFSDYLHKYGDGLLFGFGRNANPENGVVYGLKLSMFDVSDPADVTEIEAKSLDGYSSEASYNHKAILVDAEKDLIGFPMDDVYCIYGYTSEKGFYEKARIETKDGYWTQARGLYIDDYYYLVQNDRIDIIDLNTLRIAGNLTY